MAPSDSAEIPSVLFPFLADTNLRFPARPRLVKDVRLYQMPRGLGVQIRGLNAPVLVRGRGAEYAVAFLQSRLDGEHAVGDIFADCPSENKELVAKCLILLFQRELLADGDMDIRESDLSASATDSIQERFFDRFINITSFHRCGANAELQLRNSQVVAITEGLFGGLVGCALQLAGCKVNAIITMGEESGPHSAILTERASLDGIVPCKREFLIPRLSSLASQFPGTDLVICATRWASRALLLALNEFSINHKLAVLFSNETPEAFQIGPIVTDGLDGCYACMIARENSIDPLAVEEELFQQSLAELPAEVPRGESFPVALHAASIVVQEAVKYLTRISSDTLAGACITVPLLSSEPRRNRFLVVPRCLVCGAPEREY